MVGCCVGWGWLCVVLGVRERDDVFYEFGFLIYGWYCRVFEWIFGVVWVVIWFVRSWWQWVDDCWGVVFWLYVGCGIFWLVNVVWFVKISVGGDCVVWYWGKFWVGRKDVVRSVWRECRCYLIGGVWFICVLDGVFVGKSCLVID